MKNKLFILLIFVFIVIIRFWYMPFIFFRQDEWFVLGTFSLDPREVIFSGLNISRFAHFVPISKTITFSIYKIFGVSSIPYNIIGIIIHLVNSFLVFLIAKKLIKNFYWQAIALLIFLTSPIGYEQLAWPMVNINALALTFSLLAWYRALNLKASKEEFKKVLSIAFFLILAVLTVENAGPMFVFIPFLMAIYLGKKNIIKKILPILVSAGLFVIFRLTFLFQNIQGISATGSSDYINLTFLKRIIALPFRYLSQSFFPRSWVFWASLQLAKLESSSLKEAYFLTEKYVYKNISQILGLLIVFVFIYVFIRKIKENRDLAIGILSTTVFIILSSIPFIFVPDEAKYFSIIPSRYLYFGVVGSSLALGLVGNYLDSLKSKPAKTIFSLVIFSLVVFGLSENFIINRDFYKEGRERWRLLTKISDTFPDLPPRAVFYTESDQALYGLPATERILPFQSGLGQTLLVWYQETEQFPIEFFQDRFLWEITDEGYKERGDRGFGYFRDFELMMETIRERDISENSVVAFRYDSQSKLLEDMTKEVRGRIAGYLSKKRVISTSNLAVYASENNENISFAMDGRRNTFWESELPYKGQQHIKVDLKRKRKIAQVSIDSYNNKNQDKVGYRLFLSDNGEDWQEVFYAESFPPDKEGFVNLFFEPQASRYIEIREVGFHGFAPWVVHELEVYEATK